MIKKRPEEAYILFCAVSHAGFHLRAQQGGKPHNVVAPENVFHIRQFFFI